MGIQLSQKEQELLVLEIVDVCIQESEECQQPFGIVLCEKVFAGEAITEFSEMVCKTIKSLHDKGYIAGTVELEYVTEFENETLDESPTDAIDLGWSKFENISITTKGKTLMCAETFKELGKDFWEKAKPVIKEIACDTIKNTIKEVITNSLKAVGFLV